jgi:hypothetical protein
LRKEKNQTLVDPDQVFDRDRDRDFKNVKDTPIHDEISDMYGTKIVTRG